MSPDIFLDAEVVQAMLESSSGYNLTATVEAVIIIFNTGYVIKGVPSSGGLCLIYTLHSPPTANANGAQTP
jgi:hypothetical protein